MLLGVATNIFHVKIIRCGFGWNFIRIFEHLLCHKDQEVEIFCSNVTAVLSEKKCKTSDFTLETVKLSRSLNCNQIFSNL